jgi:TolA-binding protein
MNRLIIAILLIGLISCTSNKNNKKEAMLIEIEMQQDALNQSIETGKVDFQAAQLLAEKYEEFVKEFPKDTLAPDYLIDLGNLYSGMLADTEKALEKYNTIIQDYKKSEYVPVAYFLLAETYKDKLGDIENAEKYYSRLIEEFPEHDFAAQAKILLENINLSVEELYNKIKQDTNNSTVSVEEAEIVQ